MTTITDYRTSVRTMLRDTAGNAVFDANGNVTTPANPSLYVFQDYEIDSFTQSGVLLYSRFRPRRKPYMLSLVSGQAQYTLPVDWMFKDAESFNKAVQPPPHVDINDFASFVLPSLNTAAQLFTDLEFDWYDSDQFVIVNPTPQANATIPFAYFCAHTADVSSSTIPAQDFDNVVMAASSRALDVLAVDKGQKMQKYKIGQGLQIDDTAVAQRLQEQAKEFMAMFDRNVRLRPFGVMG